MRICVLTRSGRAGQGDPYVFHLGQRRHPVVAVMDEWHEEGCRCVLVRVEDGRRFVLRQDATSGEWELAAAYGGAAKLPPAATVRL